MHVYKGGLPFHKGISNPGSCCFEPQATVGPRLPSTRTFTIPKVKPPTDGKTQYFDKRDGDTILLSTGGKSVYTTKGATMQEIKVDNG